MNRSIIEFVKSARAQNASDEEIVRTLIDEGWKLQDIREAMKSKNALSGITPPSPHDNATQNLGMWDAFQNVLMFISLYVMATSISIFLHYYIDYWQLGMPIDLGIYGNSRPSPNTTLISILSASLLVSYPFFAFFFLSINKRKLKVPEIASLPLRKLLIYLTLTVTFVITLCHLIFLVFQLLLGLLIIKAILHFFVTLIVSGTIFAYFLSEVRHDHS